MLSEVDLGWEFDHRRSGPTGPKEDFFSLDMSVFGRS